MGLMNSFQGAKPVLRAAFFVAIAALSCGAPEGEAGLSSTQDALDVGCRTTVISADAFDNGGAAGRPVTSSTILPSDQYAVAPATFSSNVTTGTASVDLSFYGPVGSSANARISVCHYQTTGGVAGAGGVGGLVNCEDCVAGYILSGGLGGQFLYSSCATFQPSSKTAYRRFRQLRLQHLNNAPIGSTNTVAVSVKERLNDDNPCTIDTCNLTTGPSYAIDTANPVCVQPTVPERAVAANPAQDAASLFATQMGTLGALDPKRAGVIFGQVLETTNARVSQGLGGAAITVVGQPQLGRALSRADGSFEIAVNGGGQITLQYDKAGFISAQRYATPKWKEFIRVEDVEIQPHDDGAGTVVPVNSATTRLVQGRQIIASEDSTFDGPSARRSTMMIPSNLTATNFTSPTGNVTMHLTEFTAGPGGARRMPGTLPPNSGYTFAFDAQIDEAKAAGVARVEFNKPIPFYVENFLGFPVGETVPVGYYDEAKSQWVPETNGRIIKILGYSGTPSLPNIDTDGDGVADTGASIGITAEERERLANAYPLTGTRIALYSPNTTLWRASLTHFSKYDLNWGIFPPAGAKGPDVAAPAPTSDLPDSCQDKGGSSVSCQNRTLSEELPIVGTSHTLRYQSDRSGPAGQSVRVFLKGATAPTTAPVSAEYLFDIAGRRFAGTYPWASAPTYVDVAWDGKDGFGRAYLGNPTAHVSIGYTYAATYQRTAGFGQNGQSVSLLTNLTGNRARRELTIWKEYDVKLRAYDARGLKFGGWMLGGHHVYDLPGNTLIQSDGENVDAPSSLIRVAGDGNAQARPQPLGDGAPARNTQINGTRVVALADGSLIMSEWGEAGVNDANTARFRKIDAAGIISTVTGVAPNAGIFDGAVALNATTRALALAIHPTSGELHFLEPTSCANLTGCLGRVWKISNGIVRLVAGGSGPTGTSCTPGNCGDGLLATNVGVNLGNSPQAIAFGPDGTLYISDHQAASVRKVDNAGIISSVATFSTPPFNGGVWSAFPSPDGSLISLTGLGEAAYRTGLDGSKSTLFTFAPSGNRTNIFQGPGGTLGSFTSTSVYLGDVALAGASGSGAGNCNNPTEVFRQEGKNPLRAALCGAKAVTAGPNADIYVLGSAGGVLWRVKPAGVAPLSGTVTTIPSKDGSELYGFDVEGNHLKTVTARTGAVINTFGYTSGALTSVTDADGLTTSIARSGNTIIITAPKGQVTTLTTDANGYLSKFEKPAINAVRDTWNFTTGANGKLASQIDARGFTHTYVYDAGNRISSDTDAAGKTLSYSTSQVAATGLTVTKSTGEGRVFTYGVLKTGIGDAALTFQPRGGPLTTQARNADGTEVTNYLRATSASAAVFTTEVRTDPDPRLGVFAPIRSERTTSAYGAGSLSFRRIETRAATFTAGDVTSLTSETRTTKTNPDNVAAAAFDTAMTGELTWTEVFNRTANTRTITSAQGRTSTYTFDAKDRAVSVAIPGTSPVTYSYTTEGRLNQVTQGTRSVTMGYDTLGTLATVTDHTGRVVSYTRDALGRATQTTMPGARTLLTKWDQNDNATEITPPGKPLHAQVFDPRDLMSSYVPPAAVNVAAGAANYTYAWNNDRQLTTVTRPEGLNTLGYVVGTSPNFTNDGTLSTVGNIDGTLNYTRDVANRVTGVTNSTTNGANLGFVYSGALLTQVNWSGPFTQSVAYDYNHHFKPKTITVAGTAFNVGYDSDDLLTSVGFGTSNVQVARDATNARITGTTLSTTGATSISETRTFDPTYGELSGLSFAGASALYGVTYGRDTLGRVTTKTETIAGVTTVATYTYDAAGRLASETRAGVTTNWGYDLNGNRTSVNGTSVGTLDDQDRILPAGGSYVYNTSGTLASRIGGSYTWNKFGNLTAATVGANAVTYGYDGQNRRVVRRVNGVLQNQYIYDGQLRIVAETTPTATRRFAYASRTNVPDAMTETVTATSVTTAYKIVSDQLGSVRLVVKVSDGSVAQRLDYDAWGNIVSSTGTAIQPFGFAGGLYDPVTQWTRFGARDYDAGQGRWTSKDPSRWKGGANFYAYANNDPVSWIDPNGRNPVVVGIAVGIAFAMAADSGPAAEGNSGWGFLGGFLGGAGAMLAIEWAAGTSFMARWLATGGTAAAGQKLNERDWRSFLPAASERTAQALQTYGGENVCGMAKKMDNRQIDAIVRAAGMSKDQRQLFHQAMRDLKGADGMVSFQELESLAEDIMREYPNR
jgi:RHS repeat-associated protein